MLRALLGTHDCSRYRCRPGLLLFQRLYLSPPSPDHFQVLGVPRAASTEDVKNAFRQKAKEAHPDSSTGSDARFRDILSAYQVLGNARSRQLYELSLSDVASSYVKQAAAAQADGDRPDEPDFTAGEGWLAWATRAPQPTGNANIDRWRGDLQHQLRSAVRHAYLGPRLTLNPGDLPAQFEGEERSQPGLGDLLQLVSGRTLLGRVQVRQSALLQGGLTQQDMLHQPQAGQRTLGTATGESTHRRSRDAHANQQASTPEHTSELELAPMQKSCRCSAQLDSDSDSRDRRKAGTHHKAPPSGFHHKQDENDPEAERQDSTSSPGRAPAQQADILELLIGDDCKAVARRASAAMFRRTAAKPAVQIFDPCTGQCVAMQRGDKVHWRDAQGQLRWLTVLGGRTPLVRHLDFYASPGKNRRPLCVTTCRRAWLPPSATWLFPPRSPLHSTGGWYFEWPGPALAGHPLCLSPHIFVLLAAFATLDSERENATENSKQGFVMHMKDKAMKLLRIRT